MAEIFYHAVPGDWRREQKETFLNEVGHVGNVMWTKLTPDPQQNWLTAGLEAGFANFLPIGSKEAKHGDGSTVVFRTYCRGVCSNSDAYVYDFSEETLVERARVMVDDYETQLGRWQQRGRPKNVEEFIKVDLHVLKWIRRTKKELVRGKEIEFEQSKIRQCLYRPFTYRHYYFEQTFNEDLYQLPQFFPTVDSERENRLIVLSDIGLRSPFSMLVSDRICDLHLCASSDAFQCFPFYTYSEDGTGRRENISDSTQIAFWKRYGDESITKWDLFHYVYGLLHHPGYRERFAGNLRRELPRIPFAPDFRAFADAGRRLAELHVGYEAQSEFPLRRVENRASALSYRVERMRFTAPDRAAIHYNEFLTLDGVPPEAHAYRLGNRSALEWILDQFAVSHDKASGLTSDPNRPDDETYILRLLGKVITVSVETVRIVDNLPRDFGAGESPKL